MGEKLSHEQVDGLSTTGDHIEHDVWSLGDHGLLPREGVKATLRVLEPHQLANGARRAVGASSEEVFAAVAVHIDPLALVVEVARLDSGELMNL